VAVEHEIKLDSQAVYKAVCLLYFFVMLPITLKIFFQQLLCSVYGNSNVTVSCLEEKKLLFVC